MGDVNNKDYLPHKYKVRQWEQDFNKKNGRIPSKHDIKDAPTDIRFAYKEYYKLKTNLLSNTLSDILSNNDEDSEDYLLSTNNNISLYEQNQSDNNDIEKVNSENVINENAWTVNKQTRNNAVKTSNPKISTNSVINTKGLSFNFSKRNPRLSLNPNNSHSFSAKPTSYPIEIKLKFESLLPDFETILAEKSQKNATENINSKQPVEIQQLINNLDQNWINRCSETPIQIEKPQQVEQLGILKNSYRKIDPQPKITEIECERYPSPDSDSDGIVLNSEDESSKPVRHVRKKRKLMEQPKRETVTQIKKTVKDHKKTTIEEVSVTDQTNVYEIEELNDLDVEKNNITSNPRFSADELKKYSSIFQDFLKTDTQSSSNSIKDLPLLEKNANKNLESKIASGQLNENFVRINIQKKVFVRGHKKVNYSRHKKTLWKQKRAAALTGPEMDMNGCDGGQLICHVCNLPGHFARNCKSEEQADKLLPLDADYSQYATLEEIFSACNDIEEPVGDDDKDVVESSIDGKYLVRKTISEDLSTENGIIKTINIGSEIQPYYRLQEGGSIIETPKEVIDALKLFGHESFRHGQEKAIMRILSGLSTLVTLSTGSGKSLCYQLPAYLYKQKSKCVTIVISPLVSLMEDQVQGLPKILNAQCLHSYQSKKHFETVMDMAENKSLDILLISPEMLVSGENSSKIRYVLKKLPPIAFVCIDEAHCVSQWSHNFRPSYLMICKVIKEKLGITKILGLTATSTIQTTECIVNHLEVAGGNEGVISDIPLPDNLILSVSKDKNRDSALINLLKSEKFVDARSIIVYCTRRFECERIAGLLRTSLQDDRIKPVVLPTKKRKRQNWTAECYHAGVAASKRKSIQKSFMSGELRIVVATIAFGMGINKADIGGIIHYNMPKSFESYVQEIGRAGRDGKIAYCHLFLDSENNDQNELRRHIFANSMDRHVIRKLLHKVFVPCDCDKMARNACTSHEVCFSIEETIQQLDIPEENIETLLCYLELHEDQLIQVLSKGYSKCKIISYRGPMQLRSAAKTCAPLAMAFALDLKKGIKHTGSTNLEFDVIGVASAIGSDSGVVKFQLKNLEWIYENGAKKRSSLTVVFSDLGFRMRSPGNLSDEQLNAALDRLYNRVHNQEKNELIQLQSIFDALSKVASSTYISCSSKKTSTDSSDILKTYIRGYFKNKISLDVEINNEIDSNVTDEQIINDIYIMLSRYPDNNFTGRAIARIFHGCQSPNYKAVIWGRCQLWRSHLKVDFNRIVNLANIEIVKIKTKS